MRAASALDLLKFCLRVTIYASDLLIFFDFVSERFRLFAVRQKFYELLVNCIPPESILKVT